MIRRILRTLITLAAIIVAYQTYVLLAVPLLEPPLEIRQPRRPSDADRQRAEQSVTRYQRLLAHYFPPGHWSLAQPPKVIESGPVMFVLDDYERQEDGRVDLTRCALVIFPTPRVDGTEPPRDAIILEAPQGAKLQFDENFQPARGQLGQITRGEFPGRITIRSDMHAPGPEDDLLVETSDLEMNTKLLYTTHDVRFRLGPNEGGGREMEIRFLEEEGASSKTGGLKIAGVDSLELRRNVRLRVYLETDSLLPGNEKQRPDAKLVSQPTKPPVEVTCTGPFHFDFVRYVAGFDQNVELWQVNPDGPSDHLSCQQLDIHFVPKPRTTESTKTASFDPSQRQQKDLGRLEPDRVVAQGHPVIIVSPSRGAEARGARVQLALRERKVTIDGGSDAVLVYGPNYLRAPLVEYQHPAADATTKIGRFRAEGTGSLRYVPDTTKPEHVLEATWQGWVKLGRYNGQPLLTISGGPQLSVSGAGRLGADEMQVYLRELEIDGTKQPAVALPSQAALGGKLQVVPDRMAAIGRVQIESPQLVGRMQELRAVFRVEPEDAASGTAATSADAADGGLMSRLVQPQAGQQSNQTYQLDTDRLNLEIALRGPRAVPIKATCEGNVAFRELPTGAGGEGALEVSGGQLTLDDLDTSAHVTIVGAAPGEPAGSQLAQIQARGMTMLTAAVELDTSENRLWSDGPGKATMLVTRDLEGKATTKPFPLELQWEGGLNFDGRFVTFRRRVLVQGAEDWLRCDQLAAKLANPITFGQGATGQALDLAEVQCTGHVTMDHRSRDASGPTSHERVEIAQLTINQQTGAVTGQGPGSIRSTHFSDQTNPLVSPTIAGAKSGPSGTLASTAPASGGANLQFFRVDFQSRIEGNLYTRELELRERVRTAYGPVDSWEQELDINRPETILPGAITLTCDTLRVNEDPVAVALRKHKDPYNVSSRTMGPVQLRAEGNVRIDGESPGQGVFAAQAQRATYEQAKETFILEGTPTVPAALWHQPRAGGQTTQNSARKIIYYRLSGEFKVEDIRSFDFTPSSLPFSTPQNARDPAAGTAPVR